MSVVESLMLSGCNAVPWFMTNHIPDSQQECSNHDRVIKVLTARRILTDLLNDKKSCSDVKGEERCQNPGQLRPGLYRRYTGVENGS